MIDELKEKFEEFHDSVDEYAGHSIGSESEPNERNAGIGRAENLMAFATAVGATFLARNALQAGWRAALDRDPPKNPASPEVAWREAVVWGAVSGAVVGIVRIASRRASSGAYNRFVSRSD